MEENSINISNFLNSKINSRGETSKSNNISSYKNTNKEDLKCNNQLEELENDEVIQIIQKFYINEIKQKQSNELAFTSFKNFDWMSDLFLNKDIQNMYLQNSHIKEILIDQALFYFYIYSIIYIEWNKERQIEKAIKEQNEKEKKNFNIVLPPIDPKKVIKKMGPIFIKIGIIGLGNIGTDLLRNFINIKDKKIFNLKILVSTRRPKNISLDILNDLDENIEIFLNNERIFQECDIIFLCIQPHQLDLLYKEIYETCIERIEKLQKKEYKTYPMIVSFLNATPIERLKMFFPKNMIIVKTNLMPKNLKGKKKDYFGTANRDVQIFGQYINESCIHFINKDKINELLSYLIISLNIGFYSKLIKEKKGKKEFFPKKLHNLIIETVLGKKNSENYKNYFDFQNKIFCFSNNNKLNNEENKVDSNINEEENNLNIKENENKIKEFINDFSDYYIKIIEDLVKKEEKKIF